MLPEQSKEAPLGDKSVTLIHHRLESEIPHQYNTADSLRAEGESKIGLLIYTRKQKKEYLNHNIM